MEIAALVATTTVGFLGLAFGFWTAREERKARKELAQAERSASREARFFDARQSVYVELIHALNQWTWWLNDINPANYTYPLAPDFVATPPPRDLTHDVFTRVRASVSALGSEELVKRVDEWYDAARTYHMKTLSAMHALDQNDDEELRRTAGNDIRQLSQHLNDVFGAVEARTREDLAGAGVSDRA